MGEPVSTTSTKHPQRTPASYAAIALRVILGAVFLFAVWNKLYLKNSIEMFAQSIRAFEVGLPRELVGWAAWGVPVTEMILALALIVGFWTRGAALGLVLLLVLFEALIISAIVRDLSLDCGCFGKQKLLCDGIGWCKVGENGVLLAMALAVVLVPRHALAVENILARIGRKAAT